MYSRVLAIAATIFTVTVTLGDVTVREWSGVLGSKYQVYYPDENDPNTVNIRILESDTGTFSFEAFYTGTNNAADINRIDTDPLGVTGTVRLIVAADPGFPARTYGARTIRAIDLSTADTGEIAGMNISGDLATEGDVICDNITGDVFVLGRLDLYTGARHDLIVGTASGALTFQGGAWGYIKAGTLGDVYLGNFSPGYTQTEITITNTYAGMLTIADVFNGALTIGDPDDPNDPNDSVAISDLTGEINITGNNMGEILVTGDVATDALITIRSGGTTSGEALYNAIQIDGDLAGRINVRGGLTSAGRINIGGNVSQTDPVAPAIQIRGMLRAQGTIAVPRIRVGGELEGVIAIDGGMENATTNGPEIQVGGIDTDGLGAITIDYDGYDSGDIWDANARIKVNTTEYSGNDAAARVYQVRGCRSDMDNDGDFDGDDVTAANMSESTYAASYPGLLGSRDFHLDADCDGEITEYDPAIVDLFVAKECCFEDCAEAEYQICRIDFNTSRAVDLSDLARLLGAYGLCTDDNDYDPVCDIQDSYGCIDLADLALLLGKYGQDATCPLGLDSMESLMSSLTPEECVTLSVDAVNTNGYAGGGFVGEVDHFVFDLKIEINEPSTDDWIVNGAALTADNDATFRLSTYPTTPNQYATFIAAPWTSIPGSSTANVAGTYDPADPDTIFTTGAVNLGWYDTNTASNDGPATVMRIVIDVSDVPDADVSGGFGSVYFSTSGPKDEDDILVAELNSGTGTKLSNGLETYGGSFYVKGQ
jgi:hypothetical protein